MAEASEAQGIGGLSGMLEKMNAYKEMLERDQAQAAQQQAEQAAEDEHASIQFGAFVETAYIVAAADGHTSDAEVASLSRGITQLAQGKFSEDDVQKMLQTAGSRLQSEGRDGRIAAVASAITEPGLRRAAFLVAAGLAWLDRGVSEKEGLALQALSRAFEIPNNEMLQLLGQAKQK